MFFFKLNWGFSSPGTLKGGKKEKKKKPWAHRLAFENIDWNSTLNKDFE